MKTTTTSPIFERTRKQHQHTLATNTISAIIGDARQLAREAAQVSLDTVCMSLIRLADDLDRQRTIIIQEGYEPAVAWAYVDAARKIMDHYRAQVESAELQRGDDIERKMHPNG